MLQRFVSASTIASLGIAAGAVGLYAAAHTYILINPYRVSLIWCLLPVTWGVWAMLAPKSWMPERLPNWGALLGLIVGVMAMFVLNMPARIVGGAISLRWRGLMVLIAVIGYYLLWMLVRAVYRALTKAATGKDFKVAA